jgi:hypothetical protein
MGQGTIDRDAWRVMTRSNAFMLDGTTYYHDDWAWYRDGDAGSLVQVTDFRVSDRLDRDEGVRVFRKFQVWFRPIGDGRVRSDDFRCVAWTTLAEGRRLAEKMHSRVVRIEGVTACGKFVVNLPGQKLETS